MQIDRKRRRKQYIRDSSKFSDSQLQSQLQQQWQKITKKENLSQVDKMKQINKIYDDRKMRKKLEQNKDKIMEEKTKLMNKKMAESKIAYEKHMDDEEEGQIRQDQKSKLVDKMPTPQEFAPHIQKLLLTRAKLQNLLNLPRFQQIIKGCFIRYHSSKQNEYTISQIISSVQSSSKVYKVGRVQTNLLLKLQISAYQVLNLSMDMVSNQAQGGKLEISRWLNSMGAQVPSIEGLIKKKEELEKGTVSEISTQDINQNILKNIQKIVRKEREVREDLNIYLSFLNERDHHLEVQLKELEERGNEEDTTTGERERRGRFSREIIERPKITQTKQEILEQKQKISEYLQKLKELKQMQVERGKEKKDAVKTRQDISYDSRVMREDRILERMEERVWRSCRQHELVEVEKELVEWHMKANFDVDLNAGE